MWTEPSHTEELVEFKQVKIFIGLTQLLFKLLIIITLFFLVIDYLK